jgi:hypothetical protein
MNGMPSLNTSRTGNLLPKFLEQTRSLESKPVRMVRHLLRSDEIVQVSHEDTSDI